MQSWPEGFGRLVKRKRSKRVAVSAERAAVAGLFLMRGQIFSIVFQKYRRGNSKRQHMAHRNLGKLCKVSVDATLEAFMCRCKCTSRHVC